MYADETLGRFRRSDPDIVNQGIFRSGHVFGEVLAFGGRNQMEPLYLAAPVRHDRDGFPSGDIEYPQRGGDTAAPRYVRLPYVESPGA